MRGRCCCSWRAVVSCTASAASPIQPTKGTRNDDRNPTREDVAPPAPAAAEPAPRKNPGLLAATGSIAFATLISRITGFVKQVLLLTLLGAAVASSYTVAAQIPNMISELVLGAVLTSIVVPVLVRAEREDPDGGTAFVRRLFTVSVTVLGLAALLATAAAPVLVTRSSSTTRARCRRR